MKAKSPSGPVVPPASSEAVRKSMKSNKRKDTKPELLVRQRLRQAGLGGYRLQWKVPGRPDVAWPGKKVALFVNGCFWHRCPHCGLSLPKSNIEYWSVKFDRNVERDKRNLEKLRAAGWKVHVVWECQLRKKRREQTFSRLIPQLAVDLGKREPFEGPCALPGDSHAADDPDGGKGKKMQVAGLDQVLSDQRLEDVAWMMGESFMDERWTVALLEGLDGLEGGKKRKLQVSRCVILHDLLVSRAWGCCYALTGGEAAACAYRRSELGETSWSDIEDRAYSDMATSCLTPAEREALDARAEKLAPVSDFGWEERDAEGGDFIHLVLLAVSADARGTGAFRKLVKPFLDLADELGIPCYLECYSDRLESLYEHFGFHTVHRLSMEGSDLVERCMKRLPGAGCPEPGASSRG